MDVRAENRAFSCGPGVGERLFDPWAFGRKGQECPREIRAKKFMFMLFLSSLMNASMSVFNLTPPPERLRGFTLGSNALVPAHDSHGLHLCSMSLRNAKQPKLDNGEHAGDHNHQDCPKSTAIQVGGVLQYKLESYCDTNGRSTDSISLSSERTGTKSTSIQIGGVL